MSKLFKCNIKDQFNRFLSIEEITKLRRPDLNKGNSGIYFLFNEGELVYVGISKYIQSRIMYHIDLKKFNDIFFMEGNPNYFRLLESKCIFEYMPKYNQEITHLDEYINLSKIDNLKIVGNTELKDIRMIGGICYIKKSFFTNMGFVFEDSKFKKFKLVKIK